MASQRSDTPPQWEQSGDFLRTDERELNPNYLSNISIFPLEALEVRSGLCSTEETDPAGVGIYLRSESIDFFFKMVL